jgi:hypothetical protein
MSSRDTSSRSSRESIDDALANPNLQADVERAFRRKRKHYLQNIRTEYEVKEVCAEPATAFSHIYSSSRIVTIPGLVDMTAS